MNQNILSALKGYASNNQAKINARFFKTGPGEYGEGDEFWGITVPKIRQVAKVYKDLPLNQIILLLQNKIHEVRLCALILLISRYSKASKEVYNIYLKNTKYINSWDLVDLSSEHILGPYLQNRSKKILFKLAKSKNLWERRIAILATFHYIKQGSAKEALVVAETLLFDQHDLIQKAVGWMLREIGKRCSKETEMEFLNTYAAKMPKTTLHYALEHFHPQERTYYLTLKS